ncbi:hypothetical protein SPRG_22170 [Saprolegnia parasitica CBS 223.65]|uniref:Uncharacterized protein n=1 Tax=Saprolegnia parasitica (strain CBS 223.65) TaxID=695850 RepID=A0A067CT75_SAPPC|nr:hypothetical protein SPRG_22170 [Saprolegnia parasitica CBS 223.65]KDO29716.1 hypothetical protein SPRG_22170 [Saprolegnia parasitica CBS 223.65]|eukprot:XP_012199787.1 hypothetical protein SPRG_22170 [Saprolegnia parasitica CBS 223.65]
MPLSRVHVVPGPSSATPTLFGVHRNFIAFGISIIMLLNIASMPMKAYLSEHPPWAALPPPPTYANDSDFNIQTLSGMQAAYSASTLPAAASFYDDSARNAQVMRHVLVMSHSPIPVDDCRDQFLVGLPSVLFYGAGIRNVLCAFAAANHSSPSDHTWDRRGACMYITYFSTAIGHQCVWLRAGNELDGSNTSSYNVYTLVAAHAVYTYSAFHSFKFAYRVGISLLTLHLMWTKYFVHCRHLEALLRRRGHRARLRAQSHWRYEVLYGDPTAIILMHPGVATAFFLDCWLSVEVISLVIPRASQSADVGVMVLAFMYLSRTVWFAYSAVCLVASYLKRRHKEHLFYEVDPTIIAVGTTFYGPAVTWAMGHVGPLLTAYHYLFEFGIPASRKEYVIEGSVPSMLYSISIGFIPLVYGFVGALCHRRRSRRILSSVASFYGSFRYNGIKTQAMFAVLQWMHPSKNVRVPEVGGTIYSLFRQNARYKQSPTISFRSADCFVYCYKDNLLVERIRLSLLESLDRNESAPTLAIREAKSAPHYSFNQLVDHTPPTIVRAPKPSEWCL